MNYLTFLTLTLDLIDKASDGELTMEEIKQACSNNFPDIYEKIELSIDNLNVALEDGKVTVWEIMKILIAVVD